MFSVFQGKMTKGMYTISNHSARDEANESSPRRHPGALPCIVSASWLQRSYGARNDSVSSTLAVVERFVADMGVPCAFCTDNWTEYLNSKFVDYCNSLETPSRFHRTTHSAAKWAGHAAPQEVTLLFPSFCLEETRGCAGPAGTILWLEALLWGSECFDRTVTSVNDEWLSLHWSIIHLAAVRRNLVPGCAISCILDITTGAISTNCWAKSRGMSSTRVTSLGTPEGTVDAPDTGSADGPIEVWICPRS